MDRLDSLRIFLRVAELQSFSRAAESLGLPKASVSGAVQRLETEVGARLLQRTTRKVSLTQDGLVFRERGRDLLADFDEMQAMFVQGAPSLRGRLRVDMSSGIARNFVIPSLPDFLAAHPQLEIEVGSTDRRVDVVREGFDCVLRVGDVVDTSLIARRLGAFRLLNCASPSYVKRHGMPRTLADLSSHRLIHYVPTLGGKSSGFEYREGDAYRNLPMAGAVTVNNADAYQAACLAGLGIIQAPDVGVKRLIAERVLVEVAPKLQAEPMPVSFLYPHRRHLPPRVCAFMDWVDDLLRPHLIPLASG
ncbi:MAG: LysR family transcriptional regulator [Proteobacteria bacterium]|nr:LysR family transcriptional regulator [Pseudomonadota bacterium]